MAQNPAKREAFPYRPGNENVTLKNYSVLKNDFTTLRSPVFRGGPKYNHSWQLLMFPKNPIEGKDYLGIYLGLTELGDTDGDTSADRVVKVHFQLSILNHEGVLAAHSLPSYCYHDFKKVNARDQNFLGNLKVVDLVSTHKGLVVGDSFTFRCEIWIHGELKESGVLRLGPSEGERTKIWDASLLNDFGKLFKESIGTDVTIETTNNASLKAHKCVLMVRSPVFAAMFNAKMKEKEKNCVQITDFDDKVVEGMLEHLYTGQTDCMAERAEDLLKISEKYDLPCLKKDCEFVIADKLSKENAAVTLILAHSHNAPYLKERAVDFINKKKRNC